MNEIHATLAAWLQRTFGWTRPPEISLLRSWTNDVYRITDSDQFALKVYGIGWRTDDEIRYELDLLRHLDRNGGHMAQPILPGARHDLPWHVELNGHLRQAVVFAWASGEKPPPPYSPAMYRRQGMATATIHLAADGFTSRYARPALDLEYLVDQPIAFIESLPGNHEPKATLRFIADTLRATISGLVRQGLDWGPCHGDLTFDNVHHTAAGETVWYDFDSGGPGWRAIDLQGWAAKMPDRQQDWQAFLAGYQEIRPLGEHDIAAAPYLQLAQDVWSVEVELQRRVIAHGPEAIARLLNESAEQISERAQLLGLTP